MLGKGLEGRLIRQCDVPQLAQLNGQANDFLSIVLGTFFDSMGSDYPGLLPVESLRTYIVVCLAA